jgi:hypothetical protein
MYKGTSTLYRYLRAFITEALSEGLGSNYATARILLSMILACIARNFPQFMPRSDTKSTPLATPPPPTFSC